MKSRYDLMKKSHVKDEKGNEYPDVLTMDLKNVTFVNPLLKTQATQRYSNHPYMLTYDEYNICYFDDLVYWLNGVSYPPELRDGETLYIPNLADLNHFYSERLVSSR